MVAGYSIAHFCPMKKEDPLPQQVDEKVFLVAWPVLYGLTGVGWELSSKKKSADMMFGVLVLLVAAWPFLYSCAGRRKEAIYLLSSIVAAAVTCQTLTDSPLSSVSLSPLVAWCLVALLLNFRKLEPDSPDGKGVEDNVGEEDPPP